MKAEYENIKEEKRKVVKKINDLENENKKLDFLRGYPECDLNSCVCSGVENEDNYSNSLPTEFFAKLSSSSVPVKP